MDMHTNICTSNRSKIPGKHRKESNPTDKQIWEKVSSENMQILMAEGEHLLQIGSGHLETNIDSERKEYVTYGNGNQNVTVTMTSTFTNRKSKKRERRETKTALRRLSELNVASGSR